MVVPVCGLQLKIAIVPGATPFLISNTLLRALGALVDTGNHKLVLPKHHTEVPLKRSEKGLYLIDMNLLLKVQPPFSVLQPVAETFAQDTIQSSQNAETVNPDVPVVQMHEAGSGKTGKPSSKHATTTFMGEKPHQERPPAPVGTTFQPPVTHNVHAEKSTSSKVFSPSIRAPNRSVASRLDP